MTRSGEGEVALNVCFGGRGGHMQDKALILSEVEG